MAAQLDARSSRGSQRSEPTMLAIGIHFLTGRYAACRYNDRNRAEWPPEFARFYSALVDAWAAGGEDEREASALEWLASLGAPALWAPEAGERDIRPHFVPVNDPILAGSHNEQGKAHMAWWTLRLCRAVLERSDIGSLKMLANQALLDFLGESGKFVQELAELVRGIETGESGDVLVRRASKLEPKAKKELAKRTETLAKKAAADLVKADLAVIRGILLLLGYGVEGKKKDKDIWKKSAKSKITLPDIRDLQERTFPVAIPHEPCAFFLWSGEWVPHDVNALTAVGEHDAALEALLGRVARLGHSSTLVTCWLAEVAPEPNWFPDPDGGHVLRAVEPGQLDRLREAYTRHRAVEPRVLPARATRYRLREERPTEEMPVSVHAGGWFVFERVGGSQLPITRAADVAGALRGAIIKHAPNPVPELLSGHQPNGRPSRRSHAAFTALPFVGRPHASGLLMGAAVVLPRGLSEEEAEPLLAAIGHWRRTHDGEASLRIDAKNTWRVEYAPGLADRWTLREARWVGPATRWRTVTPVALGRNPGKLNSHDPDKAETAWRRAEATLREDVRRAGLPDPVAVNATFQPLVVGSRPAGAFGPFPRAEGEGKFRRVLIHAELIFDRPVRGPLLLGAGRHLGLGVCLPVGATEEPA